MNEEQYVTFKVAKLLKEKGFDWQTDFVWYEHLPPSIDWRNKANQKAMDYFYFNETTEHQSYYRNCDKKPSYISGDIYSAPTQQMACRWLREVHKIHITTEPLEMFKQERIVYEPIIYLLNDFDDFALEYKTVHLKECDTNEEAVEATLEYTLRNLI